MAITWTKKFAEKSMRTSTSNQEKVDEQVRRDKHEEAAGPDVDTGRHGERMYSPIDKAQ
jgi:hypothetical protein